MMSSRPTHIAGVGASAGGLDAMLLMFSRMQPTGRIAYVVAQHMAKGGHDELVVRLISRESALPVRLASDNTQFASDKVYVIPSGKEGYVTEGVLHLRDPDGSHVSTPSVNALFASIAESSKQQAIGIVLSGAGRDGTLGCKAIREHGGLVIAQLPEEAKFGGMPQAAIDAKAVDQVMPVTQIGPALAQMFPGKPVSNWRRSAQVHNNPEYALALRSPDDADPAALDPDLRELQALLPQILKATGIDFSSYKEDTLLRRLKKRKSTLGIASSDAYLSWVGANPEELRILQHLFLISVTSFFRDSDAFDVLKLSLAKMLADKPCSEPVRVWVPGCASGEEPLTLAILLRELTGKHPIQIIGTDLNQEALELARAGLYRKTAFKEMPLSLRDKYFTAHGQHWQVKPDLAACVTFNQRDVLSMKLSVPLDLISCRNLLIYMKSPLQDQLIQCFHAALRTQGLLFIGQSESLSVVGNALFVPINHYHRLFRRNH